MLKQLAITIALVFFFGAFTLAQQQNDKKEKKECAKKCCSDHNSHSSMKISDMDTDSTHRIHNKKSDEKMHQMHKKEIKSLQKDNESIIREGEIDLAAIDKNKDGKVFQDQMCWNVISDEKGECPLCGMILKEVSLEKAKENLLKHDYKVKN